MYKKSYILGNMLNNISWLNSYIRLLEVFYFILNFWYFYFTWVFPCYATLYLFSSEYKYKVTKKGNVLVNVKIVLQ